MPQHPHSSAAGRLRRQQEGGQTGAGKRVEMWQSVRQPLTQQKVVAKSGSSSKLKHSGSRTGDSSKSNGVRRPGVSGTPSAYKMKSGTGKWFAELHQIRRFPLAATAEAWPGWPSLFQVYCFQRLSKNLKKENATRTEKFQKGYSALFTTE